MSFVWKADRPLLSEEEIARIVHQVSLERDLDELASVLALMCIRQESAFWCPWNRADPSSEKYPHDSESDDGRSVAYYQQQNGRAGEVLPPGDRDNWWGPMSCRMDLRCSTNTFLERLSDDYRGVTNGVQAGRFVQRVQGSAYPDAYAKHWDYCWALLHRALDGGVQNPPVVVTPKPADPRPAPAIKPNPAWRGDPIWLPEVLRAFGVEVYEVEGARERGHGDFAAIPWVLWHHTGNVNETDDGIAHHPSLGLAANMLIHPDGRVAITGFGIAWHGGVGIYPGIPEDGINQLSIGIECAHSGAHGDPWPARQMEAMIRVGAAIAWFTGQDARRYQIAHKEWAGADNPLGINKQGKPDPIDIDMRWFRDQIAQRAAAGPTGDTTTGEDDWLMAVDTDRLNKAVDKILGGGSMPNAWDSRSIFARDGNGVDDTVGMLLHTDGNGHTAKVILGALIGFPEYVADVQRVAADGPAEGSYAAEHYFDAAQAFAQKLEPLCGKLADLLLGFPELAEAITAAPAKKAPAKRPAAKKAGA